jgi:type I site-specific restriction-modification system R (restriction) subunit
MYVDRRLAGIQAVQTLSRLNRAHPGKDTTYILDFVNSSEEILAAFKTFYETAELEGVTDPNLVYAIVDGLDVRDSRIHNCPPRWNGAKIFKICRCSATFLHVASGRCLCADELRA